MKMPHTSQGMSSPQGFGFHPLCLAWPSEAACLNSFLRNALREGRFCQPNKASWPHTALLPREGAQVQAVRFIPLDDSKQLLTADPTELMGKCQAQRWPLTRTWNDVMRQGKCDLLIRHFMLVTILNVKLAEDSQVRHLMMISY